MQMPSSLLSQHYELPLSVCPTDAPSFFKTQFVALYSTKFISSAIIIKLCSEIDPPVQSTGTDLSMELPSLKLAENLFKMHLDPYKCIIQLNS